MSGDVLFVGLGCTVPMYYRVMLPAQEIGADYIGVRGAYPNWAYVTGLVQGKSETVSPFNYKLVILQQPHGEGWCKAIKALQANGTKVLFEVDDHLHSVAQQKDHDFKKSFLDMAGWEMNMRAADGLIVSTPWLAKAYRPFNKRSWVCRNGIDPARYAYALPERPTVNYGFAGATGHKDSAMPWLQATALAMAVNPETCFVSIGPEFAEGFVEHFGPARALSVPFCAIEQYPAAMTHMDVALGPAGRSNFFKAKSDLRWLEAGALGIPLVGHPAVYGGIKDRVNGFRAMHPAKVTELLIELATDHDLRRRVGEAARAHVLENRTISQTACDWEAPLQWAEAGS